MDIPKKDDRKKKEHRSHRPATRVIDPPSPKHSEQVPAGDDSDITLDRDLDEKDVDRDIEPVERDPKDEDGGEDF
jgi:hypothetical protein